MARDRGVLSERSARTGTSSGAFAWGVGLTLIVVGLTAAGYLAQPERALLDLRFAWCSRFTPPPSDRIVHIDIDDNALRTQRWPWPRRDLARVVDQLHQAGAKVIAFDLLFDDPQPPDLAPLDSTEDSTEADQPLLSYRVYDDQQFARAIRDAGNVLLPVNLRLADSAGPTSVAQSAIDLLADEPALTIEQLIGRMGLTSDQARRIRDTYASLFRRAMRDRLKPLTDGSARVPSFDEVRAELLGFIPASVSDHPKLSLLRQEYDRMRSAVALGQRLPRVSAAPFRPGGESTTLAPPVPVLARAAATSGFVTYDEDADATLRSVPLWLAHRDRLYPHFALAVACAYLDVPLDQVDIQADHVVIPPANAEDGPTTAPRRLPLLSARPGDRWRVRDGRLMITWPTNARQWAQLYDPDGPHAAGHISIGAIIETDRLLEAVAHNQATADAQLIGLARQFKGTMLESMFPDEPVEQLRQAARTLGRPDPPEDLLADARAQRESARSQLLNAARSLLDELGDDPQALDEGSRRVHEFVIRQMDRYQQAVDAARAGLDQVNQFRDTLGEKVNGRICLVGWTATGALADFLPTSLHGKCPGVVIHGAVVNAILTRHFMDRVPLWVDLLVIGLAGVGATWITGRYPPVRALLIIAVGLAGYLLINGFVLFDWADTQVAAASPLMAGAAAWIIVTVYRLVLEQRQRLRITRQFKNYVSPDLVQLLVDNPSMIKTGRHELTCMFSDIAGFTSVSEKLGPEQTIALLNEYLRAMTQLIMEGRGTVNKYLGDGLMAFWGAPLDDDEHALHCCDSALRCVEALDQLADDKRFADLPRLFMRVGIATGPMMVGDCGAPPQRSDYTVIGDTVNLASRLEGANKALGTQILLSDRAAELIRDQMLSRVVGRIVVVGRASGETVHELLARRDQATEQHQALAQATTEAVQAYFDGQFEKCRDLFQQIIDRFGTSQLADLYIEQSQHHLQQGTRPEDHDGSIVLSEK